MNANHPTSSFPMQDFLTGFAAGIYREHLSEASFLYEQRLVLLDDPKFSWLDIADFEHRIEPHLSALSEGGEQALELCKQQAIESDFGELYGALCVFCRKNNFNLVMETIKAVDLADEQKKQAIINALKHESPAEWENEFKKLCASENPFQVILAAEVLGFQRRESGPELLKALEKSDPLATFKLIWALGRINYQDAKPLLRTFLCFLPSSQPVSPSLQPSLPSLQPSLPSSQPVPLSSRPSPFVISTPGRNRTGIIRNETLHNEQTEHTISRYARYDKEEMSFRPSSLSLRPSSLSLRSSSLSFRPSSLSFRPSSLSFRPSSLSFRPQGEIVHETLAAQAALALLRLGDSQTIDECLHQASTHTWPLVLLAISAGPEALDVLLKHAAAEQPCQDCLLALGLFGAMEAIPILISQLSTDLTEQAAFFLNLITGAGLYEEVFIPEPLHEDALFDEEKEKLSRGEPLYTPDEQPGETITRLSRDPELWQNWWEQNKNRFVSGTRFRYGRPFSPACILETLESEKSPRFLRQWAYEEWVIRYGADFPFEIDMFVTDQKASMEQYSRWAEANNFRFQNGEWYLMGL